MFGACVLAALLEILPLPSEAPPTPIPIAADSPFVDMTPLAMFLLNQPVAESINGRLNIYEVTQEEWPALQNAVWTVAINLELMDPRETNFLINRTGDFESDVNILRRRNEDLRDAPKMTDALRLPERGAVNEMCSFNRAFRIHVERQMVINKDREEIHKDILKETDHLFAVWDAIRDARCESFYVMTRRMAMKRLVRLIGDEAFYTLNLPPYVPVWRFQEQK